jgi:hypothetical protein
LFFFPDGPIKMAQCKKRKKENPKKTLEEHHWEHGETLQVGG